MNFDDDDDAALDALLRRLDGDDFADAAAFTAAVMQRVRDEGAAARVLDAPSALARLQREEARRRRAAAWRRAAIAAGSALAATCGLAFGAPAALALPHAVAAVVLAAAVCVWALAVQAPSSAG